MDSAYCLHWAKREFPSTWALFVDYGQRAVNAEALAAKRIAAKAEIPLTLMKMHVSWKATLCAISRPLRAGVDDEGVSNAFVPGRNLHLLTLAAAHTREVNAGTLVIGCCGNDAAAFPDCRPDFLRAAGHALGLALNKTLHVIAPVVYQSKEAILRMARTEPAIWEAVQSSWSCYTPTREGDPCGECDACTNRDRAFAAVESLA
jgi:7-cyano-7-deazaguanine synthase